jgi:glutaredoxin 3
MKVIIYGTTWCPHCIDAKQFFKEKNIEFEFINVDDDSNSKLWNELSAKHGYGVPQIKINQHYIVGFDKGALEEALRQCNEKS